MGGGGVKMRYQRNLLLIISRLPAGGSTLVRSVFHPPLARSPCCPPLVGPSCACFARSTKTTTTWHRKRDHPLAPLSPPLVFPPPQWTCDDPNTVGRRQYNHHDLVPIRSETTTSASLGRDRGKPISYLLQFHIVHLERISQLLSRTPFERNLRLHQAVVTRCIQAYSFHRHIGFHNHV